jgi:hypothetical protein
MLIIDAYKVRDFIAFKTYKVLCLQSLNNIGVASTTFVIKKNVSRKKKLRFFILNLIQ